ncbi:hypothetical protein [Streptomyces sp. NPDC094032]|uniref:hypothetical protein n=1 Tax=Streptomyces sp. NPDC094032 TaxID=3155308 RepID=UPI003322BC48
MSRARRPAAALVLAGALLTLTACASSPDPIDPIERLGRKAAEKVSPHPPRTAPSYGTAGSVRAFFQGCPRLTPRGRELALRLTEC